MQYMCTTWLIGMPASGKSTLCKACAGIDTDDIIDLHQLLPRCLNPDEFYTAEANAIINFIENNTVTGVIATGGSVVHRKETMSAMQNNGTIIWLYCPLEVIQKRLGDYSTRGIVMPDGITTLEDLYHNRMGLYAKYADIQLDTSKHSMEECVKIIKALAPSQ
tara:strand:+ start:8121 stop:8609 length:489 start_codon:yes stop_codon:yes gene_type:complete